MKHKKQKCSSSKPIKKLNLLTYGSLAISCSQEQETGAGAVNLPLIISNLNRKAKLQKIGQDVKV